MIETIAVISVAAVGIAWGFFTLGRLSTKVDWAWSRPDLSRFWFEEPLRCKLKAHAWETVFDVEVTLTNHSLFCGEFEEQAVAEKHRCRREGCNKVRGYVRRVDGPNKVVPLRLIEEAPPRRGPVSEWSDRQGRVRP